MKPKGKGEGRGKVLKCVTNLQIGFPDVFPSIGCSDSQQCKEFPEIGYRGFRSKGL